MKIVKNIILQGKHQKPILLDAGYQLTNQQKPVVIFAHGFKGFKDWGHFNLVMNHFVENQFVFVKFNFSHNGGTLEQPIDFPDLEAFGNNNYTKELDDLETVIDWVELNQLVPKEEINSKEIYLIGHSRGGGISIVKTSEDARIKKLVTWAAVSDLINRIPSQQMEIWKQNGVIYVENARTNQQMPMYYQLAEDTFKNKERLTIERAAKTIHVPQLIVHGTNDEAVQLLEAQNIAEWNSNAELFIVENANHTFGAAHPFNDEKFPLNFQMVIDKTLDFLRS